MLKHLLIWPISLVMCGIFSPAFGASNACERFGISRGINITNWFRHPPSQNKVDIERYINDEQLRQIAYVGFDFVRLAVMPTVMRSGDSQQSKEIWSALFSAIDRINRAGVKVIVTPFCEDIDLLLHENQNLLIDFLLRMARHVSPARENAVFIELLNEPHFKKVSDWTNLEERIRKEIMITFPGIVFITSGNDWSSLAALSNRMPLDQNNMIYTFHYYDPPVLTRHGNWDPRIDGSSLANLPFPVDDVDTCKESIRGASDRTAIRWGQSYCSAMWNIDKLRIEFKAASDWAAKNNACVVAAEFGILDKHDRSSRLRYLFSVTRALEGRKLPWALWGYDDWYGLSVPARAVEGTPSLDMELLKSLGLKSSGSAR